MTEITVLLTEFERHAENCPGCATSLAVGTWFAHRCGEGKRIARRVITLMRQGSTD